jgi:ribulose kinase
VPISFTRVSDGPVLGSAMLAAIGAGIYPDIPAAAENMQGLGTCSSPAWEDVT